MKKIALLAALVAFVGVSQAAQPFAAWTKYRDVTINTTASGANVATTQTNFPVLVRLANTSSATGSEILAEALAGGADIRFSDSTGNVALEHEIEHWSTTSAAIWVRVPSVTGNANTKIRLYWNRSGAPTGSNPAGVFGNNNFLGVWHMGTATGAAARVNAANPGTNDAMPAGSATATMTPKAGIIGMSDSLRAQTFESGGQETDDHFNLGQITFPNTQVTVSMWVNHPDPQNFTNWNHYFTHGNGNLEHNLWFGRNSTTNGWRARGAGPSGESGNAGSTTVADGLLPLAEWMHLAVSKDSTDGMRWRMFKNGAMLVNFMPTATLENHVFIAGTRSFNYIGRSLWADPNSHIKVDEMRTSAIARNPDWMKLEFETQKAAATALTLGTVQTPAAPTLAYVVKNATYLVNQAITTNNPVTSGAASAWAITPALPAGLSFNTSTGVITGTPTAASASAQYRVTATVGGNPAADTLTIAVSAGTPPGAPTAVTAVRGNAQVTVGWTAPASSGSSAITGYTARATQDNTKTCTWTTGPLTCTVTGLTNGTAYTFEVRATSAAGNGPFSTASASVTPATVPDAPTAVTAVQQAGGATAATVSWTAPTATGGSAITSYTARATQDTTKTCVAAATTCSITGLTAGSSYTFVVRATNAVGNSAFSTASSSITVGILPGSFAIHVTGSSKPFAFTLTPEAAASTEALTMSIMDMQGRTVWSKSVNPAKDGTRELSWNGVSSTGRAVSAGVYMVRVATVNGGNTADFIRPAVSVK